MVVGNELLAGDTGHRCRRSASTTPTTSPVLRSPRPRRSASLRPGIYRDTILLLVRSRIAASVGDEAAARRASIRRVSTGHPVLVDTVQSALGLAEYDAADVTSNPYALTRAGLSATLEAYEAHRLDEAWSSLEHTLALVERNSFRRAFLDSGLSVRPLLRDYIAEARPFSQVAWQLLRRLPADREADSPPLLETLTAREIAVLRHLPTMKSNSEIAAEMYFSVNTVKTHLKSIYRKLGVNRRRAAVEEARARALL